jgi:YD repeat-containing protein
LGWSHNYDIFLKQNSNGSIVLHEGNGNKVTFGYIGDNLTGIYDPAGRITTLSYDANNHLTSVTDPNGNAYTFINSGNTLASVVYPDGGTWRYTYDANAFMFTKTDPLGATTTYAYDDSHRVTSSTDPEGKVRQIAYPQGTETNTTAITEKDGGVWQYSYDTQKGTLAQKTDPQGGIYGPDGFMENPSKIWQLGWRRMEWRQVR